jgi:hypothetical protein
MARFILAKTGFQMDRCEEAAPAPARNVFPFTVSAQGRKKSFRGFSK